MADLIKILQNNKAVGENTPAAFGVSNSIDNVLDNNINQNALDKTISNISSAANTEIAPDFRDSREYEKYDVSLNPVDKDLDKLRAKNQSAWEQAFHSLSQAVVSEVGLGTLLGASNLVDAIGSAVFEGDGDYSNPLSAKIEELQESFRNATPIYQENPNESFQLGDFGWWAANAPSVASSLSLLIPAAGATKALSLLGKVIKGTKVARGVAKATKLAKLRNALKPSQLETLSHWGNVGTTAAFSRTMENYQEARQTYNTVFEESNKELADMNDKDFDNFLNKNEKYKTFESKEDIAKDIASKSADVTFVEDYANVVFDIVQLHALKNVWKGLRAAPSTGKLLRTNKLAAETVGKSADEIAQIASNRTLSTKTLDAIKNNFAGGKTILFAEASEGVEEAVNYIAQQEGINYGKTALGKTNTKFDDRLADYLTDGHLYESAFWGWLGGITFQGLGSGAARLKNKIINKEQLSEEQVRKAEILKRNERWTNFTADMEKINNNEDIYHRDENQNPIQFEANEYKELAAKRRQSEYIRDITLDAANVGNLDLLRSYIKDKNVQAAFVEKGVTTAEEADNYTNELLNQIDEVEKSYDNNLLLLDNKKVEPAFARIIATKNVRNDIETNNLNGELQSIDKEITRLMEEENISSVVPYNAQETINNSITVHKLRQLRKELRKFDGDKSLGGQIAKRNIQKEIDLVESKIKNSLSFPFIKYESLINDTRDKEGNIVIDNKEAQAFIDKHFEDSDKTLKEANIHDFMKQRADNAGGIIKLQNDVSSELINNMALKSAYELQIFLNKADKITTDSQIKEEVSKLTNMMDDAKRSAIEKSFDTAKNMFTKYDTNLVFGYINGQLEEIPDMDAKDKAELDDALTILDLTSEDNEYLYDSLRNLATVTSIIKDSKPKTKVNDSPVDVVEPEAPSEPVEDEAKEDEIPSEAFEDDDFEDEAKKDTTESKVAPPSNEDSTESTSAATAPASTDPVTGVVNPLEDTAKKEDSSLKNMTEEERKVKNESFTEVTHIFIKYDASLIFSYIEGELEEIPNMDASDKRKLDKALGILNLTSEDNKSTYDRLKNIFADIPKPIDAIAPPAPPVSEPTKAAPKPATAPTKKGKRVSFTNNKDKYLTEQTEDKDLKFFDAEINDDGTGTFEITSLKRVKSYDDIDSAVVTVGGVTWNDASTYRVLEKGEIKRNESGIYEITKPTKIELIRAGGVSKYDEAGNLKGATAPAATAPAAPTAPIAKDEIRTDVIPDVQTNQELESIGNEVLSLLKVDANTNLDEARQSIIDKYLVKGYNKQDIENQLDPVIRSYKRRLERKNAKTKDSTIQESFQDKVDDIVVRNSTVAENKIDSEYLNVVDNYINSYIESIGAKKLKDKTFVNLESLMRFTKDNTSDPVLANIIYNNIKDILIYESNNNGKYILTDKKNVEKLSKGDFFNNVNKTNKERLDETFRELDKQRVDIYSQEETPEYLTALQSIQSGQKLDYDITDKEILIKSNNVAIGRLPLPRKTATGGYLAFNDGWKYNIDRVNGKVESPLKDLFKNWLVTRTNDESVQELNYIINNVAYNSALTAEQKAELIKQFENNKEIINARTSGFMAKNASSEQLLDGIATLYKYVGQQFDNTDRYLAINQWFDKLANSYDGVTELAKGNKEVKVATISDGALIINPTNKLEPVKDAVVGFNPSVNKIMVSTKDGQLDVAGTNEVISWNARTGSTFVLIPNRSGNNGYAQAFPNTLSDETNSAQVKDMVNHIKTSITELYAKRLIPVDEGGITFDEFRDTIRGLFSNGKGRTALIGNIAVVETPNSISISVPRTNLNITFFDKTRQGTLAKMVGLGEGKGFAEMKATSVISTINDIIDKGNFIISFGGVKSDAFANYPFGDNKVISKKDGKFNISVNGRNWTFNSFNDFILDNNLVKVHIGKTADGSSNFERRGITPGSNQVLNIELVDRSNSPLEASAPTSSPVVAPAVASSESISDKVKAIITNTKIKNKGSHIAELLSDKSTKDLFKRLGIIPENVIFVDEISDSNGNKVNAQINVKTGIVTITNQFLELAEHDKKQAFRKLIHEGVHNKLVGNEEVLAQIESVYDEFKASLDNVEADAHIRQYAFDSLNRELAIEEFFVESLTSRELANYLNNVESNFELSSGNKKSLFQKIMEALCKLMGININEASLLQKEFLALNEINNKPTAIQAEQEVVVPTESSEESSYTPEITSDGFNLNVEDDIFNSTVKEYNNDNSAATIESYLSALPLSEQAATANMLLTGQRNFTCR